MGCGGSTAAAKTDEDKKGAEHSKAEAKPSEKYRPTAVKVGDDGDNKESGSPGSPGRNSPGRQSATSPGIKSPRSPRSPGGTKVLFGEDVIKKIGKGKRKKRKAEGEGGDERIEFTSPLEYSPKRLTSGSPLGTRPSKAKRTEYLTMPAAKVHINLDLEAKEEAGVLLQLSNGRATVCRPVVEASGAVPHVIDLDAYPRFSLKLTEEELKGSEPNKEDSVPSVTLEHPLKVLATRMCPVKYRGSCLRYLTGNCKPVMTIGLSKDERTIAMVMGRGKPLTLGVQTGGIQTRVPADVDRRASVVSTGSGGRTLRRMKDENYDRAIRYYDLRTSMSIGVFKEKTETPQTRDLCFLWNASDPIVLAGTSDGSVRTFTSAKMKLSKEMAYDDHLGGELLKVSQVGAHPRNTFLACSGADEKQIINVWSIESFTSYTHVASFQEHTKAISEFRFHPEDPVIVSGDLYGVVLVWHCKSGVLLQEILSHTIPVRSITFVGNNLYTSDERFVRCWVNPASKEDKDNSAVEGGADTEGQETKEAKGEDADKESGEGEEEEKGEGESFPFFPYAPLWTKHNDRDAEMAEDSDSVSPDGRSSGAASSATASDSQLSPTALASVTWAKQKGMKNALMPMIQLVEQKQIRNRTIAGLPGSALLVMNTTTEV